MSIISIFGGSGLLGRSLCKEIGDWFEPDKLNVYNSTTADICNADLMDRICGNSSIVVNSAAYTDVDECKDYPAYAHYANSIGPYIIGRACKRTRYAHISTDMVFGGAQKARYYTTESKTCPVNTYGQTKEIGEELARSTMNANWIFRVSNLYGQDGRNWASKVRDKLVAGETVHADDIRVLQPTWTGVAAFGIARAMYTYPKARNLTMHVVARGETTWYCWAREMAKMLGRNTSLVKPLYEKQLPYRDARSNRIILSESEVDFSWQDCLRDYLVSSF